MVVISGVPIFRIFTVSGALGLFWKQSTCLIIELHKTNLHFGSLRRGKKPQFDSQIATVNELCEFFLQCNQKIVYQSYIYDGIWLTQHCGSHVRKVFRNFMPHAKNCLHVFCINYLTGSDKSIVQLPRTQGK